MKIKKVVLKNYRCFEDLDIEFHDNLTLLVGNNGSGKTCILEAITVSLGTFFAKMNIPTSISIKKKDVRLKAYQINDVDDVQLQFPVEIIAEGVVGEKQIKWKRTLNSEKGKTTFIEAKQMTEISEQYQKRLQDGDRDLILPVLAYYGTGRLWDYHKEKRYDTFKVSTRTNGYIDCMDGTANIKLMMNWFQKRTVQTAQKNANGFNAFLQLPVVYEAMSRCCEKMGDYQNVRFEFNMDTYEIDCYYLDNEGFQMKIPLSQMSDGYKSTISLVADIAYRMAVLNPQLGTEILNITDGVILIDEVDLHLHPRWQQRILETLQDIFPKVQFIATTHAPETINSVKSENLIMLQDYEVKEPVEEVFGNDVNSILNTIMNVSERTPRVSILFEEFYHAIKEKKFDKAETILDDIDELRDYHDKQVAADRVKLKLERIRGVKDDSNKERT